MIKIHLFESQSCLELILHIFQGAHAAYCLPFIQKIYMFWIQCRGNVSYLLNNALELLLLDQRNYIFDIKIKAFPLLNIATIKVQFIIKIFYNFKDPQIRKFLENYFKQFHTRNFKNKKYFWCENLGRLLDVVRFFSWILW